MTTTTTTLAYALELFDTDGDLVQSTGGLGPVDVLAELHLCEGLSDELAARVFPVLAAAGEVEIVMPGGWSFRLTSEEDR